jgi:outer membrane protein assembly factor BamB
MRMSQTGDGTWTLHAADRATGEERCKFAGLSPIPTPAGFNQGAPTYRIAQANGHLLLLTLGQYAYCFDLAEKRQLWQYNLLGTTQPTGNPRVEQTSDGDVEFLYEDGWRLRLGRSSVLEPTYACLVTRDGLVALDPVTGQKLWLRSNVSSKVQVFGDARNVFVIDGARSRVLRAVDGTQRDGVPDFAALVTGKARVAVLDRLVLLNEGGGSKPRVLRLYDPLTGKDVWKREYPAHSVLIKTLSPRTTGCLSPDGKFEVIESRTGKALFRGGVGEQDPVHKFDPARVKAHLKDAAGNMVVTHPLLLADAERFYLFLNRDASTAVHQQYGLTIRQQSVNGVAYGFDRATGKRLWFTDHEFDNQMLLLERFEDLPVIVASAQGSDPKTRMPNSQVVILDKQLGKVKYYHRGGQAGYFVSVNTDTKTGVTEFWRYDMRLRIVPDEGAAK